MEIQQGLAVGNIDLRLYENETPLTVANFLKYVNSATVNGGNYVNSFVNRRVPDFVVQGGGFSFDPLLKDGSFTANLDASTGVFDFPGGLHAIPSDDSVLNEPGISNLRGTIAMAKLSEAPDSATNEWFINIANNASILDDQNGGFTVFGEVIADGMTVVDSIAGQAIFDKTDIHSAFAELPLLNYVTGAVVLQENLVRVNSMTEVLTVSEDINFKAVLLNTTNQSEVTLNNSGNSALQIGDIATSDTIDAPFSLLSNTCSNTTLAQGALCTLNIQFNPQTENVFNDTFNIELIDLALSYSFSLVGEGVTTAPAPDILIPRDIVDFGEVQVAADVNTLPEQIVILIENIGNLDLNITSMTLSGTDTDNFQIFDNCVNVSPVIANDSCVLPVNFKSLDTGEKNALITIISDDPDEGTILLPLKAIASIDTDGVLTTVEDAAPNNGDGNNDNVLDSMQSDVVSLPSGEGVYITLLSRDNVSISNVIALANDQLVAPPENVNLTLGALNFAVKEVTVGGSVDIGLILPANEIPVAYYIYGPTADNTNPHWYDFTFDGTTGVLFVGNANISSPDGNNINRNLLSLFFKDGARGDADLLENGVIVNLGAVDIAPMNTASGSLNGFLLLGISLLPGFFRYICKAATSSMKHQKMIIIWI